MQEIDGMDMLGFLRLRAWDARRKYDQENIAPKKVYIDEIWSLKD